MTWPAPDPNGVWVWTRTPEDESDMSLDWDWHYLVVDGHTIVGDDELAYVLKDAGAIVRWQRRAVAFDRMTRSFKSVTVKFDPVKGETWVAT